MLLPPMKPKADPRPKLYGTNRWGAPMGGKPHKSAEWLMGRSRKVH